MKTNGGTPTGPVAEQEEFDKDVRLMVYSHIVEFGYPPAITELAVARQSTPTAVRASLQRLQEGRALLLNPGATRIDAAPPISALPTPHWVETSVGAWWGHTPWQALAVATMLGQDARITTSAGATGDRLEIIVENGRIARGDALIHIAVPAARWWDDVWYTCATMLCFRSRSEIAAWCRRHGIPAGETVTLEQALFLARVWYEGRLDREWRRISAAEARQSFIEVGLTGPFWKL